MGYSADKLGPCVVIENSESLAEMRGKLLKLFHKHTTTDIAEKIHPQPLGKFDEHLGEALIKRAFVEEKLNIKRAVHYLDELHGMKE